MRVLHLPGSSTEYCYIFSRSTGRLTLLCYAICIKKPGYYIVQYYLMPGWKDNFSRYIYRQSLSYQKHKEITRQLSKSLLICEPNSRLTLMMLNKCIIHDFQTMLLQDLNISRLDSNIKSNYQIKHLFNIIEILFLFKI